MTINDEVHSIAISEFDYPLPDERIAKYPLAERDACKLLVRRSDGKLSTFRFRDIVDILEPSSLLVCNNTRVINARLRFRKGDKGDGALIEIFCLEPVEPVDYQMNFASADCVRWLCFVGNSKRWKEGVLTRTITLTESGKDVVLNAKRISVDGNTSVVEFSWDAEDVTFSEIISAAGEIPIPPYLNRSTEQSDSQDYQTVYSNIEGSVAAPTAGLHFTRELLARLADKGIDCEELTLHVGAGTFQPVKSEQIGEHEMHSEFFVVDRELIETLRNTDRRVMAVGTTSVRTLESLYQAGCMISQGIWDGEVKQWYSYSADHPRLTREVALQAVLDYLDERKLRSFVGSTRVIIAPGYDFKIVQGIITNFHQPHSTLLLLVSAFVEGHWREIYDYALAGDYRFLSYGDASLLLR